MAIMTYPLNNVEYQAEDAEVYNSTRMSGVWSGKAFDFEVVEGTNTVKVGKGLAWIKNAEFTGKAVASKEEMVFDFGLAPSAQARIDVLAIQFSSVDNETRLVIKNGSPSNNPEIPEISQTESLYELYLFSVLRRAGAASIVSSDITDLRDNREYCGYMQDAIKPGYAPSLMDHNKGEDFRFWSGKKAEYEEQKEDLKPNTFCVVIDDNDVSDYVIEQGEKNGWTYRKWNSGIAEAWRYTDEYILLDTEWEPQGTVYMYGKSTGRHLSVSLPLGVFIEEANKPLFSNVQPLSYGQMVVGGSEAYTTRSNSGGNLIAENSVRWSLMRHWAPDGHNYPSYFSVEVKGRWK